MKPHAPPRRRACGVDRRPEAVSFRGWVGPVVCAGWLWGALGGAAETDLSQLPPPASVPADFGRDVQPLLESRCLKCHGPEKPKSGLRLDGRESVLRGGNGGLVVIPGQSARSRLVHLVAALNPDEAMPPAGKGERLTREQVGRLRAWIDAGAKWPAGLVLKTKEASNTNAGMAIATADATKLDQVPVITRPVDFATEVFPIFQQRCFECHGPQQQKAELRLDAKPIVFKGGKSGPTITPGNASSSLLFRRAAGLGSDDQMPPKGPKLSAEQLGLVRAWLDQGAPWPDGIGVASAEVKRHWAYVKPVRPSPPPVKNHRWARNPIDQFILARLEQEGLAPAHEADRRTLIRRASLDLIGLPPSPAEVEAFVRDRAPEAYERLIERLLASPHYGERWARPWLDLARYADTNGYEKDDRRSIWLYRDWVIRALNRNLPFDQFTLEQLAGDLLPNATVDQKIATGFHRNTMVNTEGGTDDEEFRVAAVVDRVNTTFNVWFGSTLNCAQCHNHKYDPFTQKEYYQVFAFLNQTRDPGKENKPELSVPTPEQAAKLAEVRAKIEPLQKRLDTQTPELDAAQAAWEARLQVHRHILERAWHTLEPTEVSASNGARLEPQPDHSLLLVGPVPDTSVFEVTARAPLEHVSGLRVEALVDERLPLKSSGTSLDGEFVLSEVTAEARPLVEAPQPKFEPPQLGPWHSLGPFPAGSMAEAFSKAFIDEAKPDLAQTYANGGLRWLERPEFKDGQVNELKGENSATYLFRTLSVREARPLVVALGSDDGLQVWLNGERVLARDVARAAAPDQESLKLDLAPGVNRLLLKVNNGGGGYGFYFAVPEDQRGLYRLEFSQAYADFAERGFEVEKAIDGDPKTGWAIGADQETNRVNRAAVLVAKTPAGHTNGTRLVVRLRQESNRPKHLVGRFRLAASTAPVDSLREWGKAPADIRALLEVEPGRRQEAQRAELARYYRTIAPALDSVREQMAQLRKLEPKDVPTTLVMEATEKPRPTRLLKRGSHLNPGDEVTPGVPAVLHRLPPGAPLDRLSFAKWVISPDNPLVGRVTVNRVWAQYFGRGLVETSDDFGAQGELPTHPELLDWLACEFLEPTVAGPSAPDAQGAPGHGAAAIPWSLKHLHRLIVTSATYRQSAGVSPALLARDPLNKLHARGARFRLEAEMVRDYGLAVSGLLNRHIGGPSVFPYQPDGVWAMPYSGDKWVMNQDGNQFRRGLYTFWRRSAPYAAFVTFDAPSREVCTERRPRTNTPLQALTTLNDPAHLAAAAALARKVVAEAGAQDKQRLAYAFAACLNRPPKAPEARRLLALYHQSLAKFAANPKAAGALAAAGSIGPAPKGASLPELAAWTVLANVLLNLDETLTKG